MNAIFIHVETIENMDKFLYKIIDSSEYEIALMNRYSEEYDVKSIEWIIGTNKYKISLEKKE